MASKDGISFSKAILGNKSKYALGPQEA